MRNSGVIQTVINTREQLVSSDINGLQYNQSAALMQVVRRLWNDRYTNVIPGQPVFSSTGGVSGNGIPNTAIGVGTQPLAAEIFGGLMVQPGSGAASLLVQAGTLGCIFPTTPTNPLDSPYTLVDDPGVQLLGVIPFVANPGVFKRGGWVECSPVLTVLTVENRNIFDPITGLFIPTPVVKSAAARLTYRWRQATVDTKIFPILDPYWTPLAYTCMRPGALTFDDCTFYDVRNLITDRPYPFSRDETSYGVTDTHKQVTYSVTDAGGGPRSVVGMYDIIGEGFDPESATIGGKSFGRVSGKIFKSTPSLGGARVNSQVFIATASENIAPFTTSIASTFHFVVALFPLGLPRWSRYMELPINGQRYPEQQRGLMTVTSLNCDADGKVLGVELPPGLDIITGNTASGRMIAPLYFDSSSAYAPMRGSNDGWIMFSEDTGNGDITLATQSPGNNGAFEFDVNMNQTSKLFPWMDQISVTHSITLTPGAAPGTAIELETYFITSINGTKLATLSDDHVGFLPNGFGALALKRSMRIPLGQSQKAIDTRYLRADYTPIGGAGGTLLTYRLSMNGFKLGW